MAQHLLFCGAMVCVWLRAQILESGIGLSSDSGLPLIAEGHLIFECHIPHLENGRIPVSWDCCMGQLRKPIARAGYQGDAQ